MTNNLNTIEGAQQEVIDQLEYNLQAKGVLDAQFNPTTGLLGLINRIPDIEPSTNINLNITLILTSAEPSVDYGGSILLSATLMASYEGASDVDLKTGEITGATITFKKGGTIIGTSITDNNGVATLLYTPVAADCDTTLNLSAVFSGTDNFNSANSNNINVDVNSTLELTSDKDILSYADNEYATLTATLNSVDKNNKEVIFEVRKQSDDSLVETLTGNTDSSGNATVYYYGKDTGNLYIQAFSSSVISTKTFNLIDAKYYASNSRINNEGVPYNNDRKIFSSTYTVLNGDEIHFRLKTDPITAIMGIGSLEGSDCTFLKNTNGTFTLYRNWGTNGQTVDAREGFSSSQEWIIIPAPNNSSNPPYTLHIYQGDTSTEIDWWGMKFQIKKIRVDKFYNYDFEVEVYVL